MSPIFTLQKSRDEIRVYFRGDDITIISTNGRGIFHEYLSGLKEDREYECIIRKPEEARSRLLEKYYWAVCVHMWSQHVGLRKLEAHYNLLEMCAQDERRELTTSKMNRETYSNYVEEVRQFMAENGCVVPDPQKSELI